MGRIVSRMMWAGHLVQMEEVREQRLLNSNAAGKEADHN